MTATRGNVGSLTMAQGAALDIGAVLGTGVIALPALVAQVAGPASLVACPPTSATPSARRQPRSSAGASTWPFRTAAALMVIVTATNAFGVTISGRVQLVLAGLLVALLVTAVIASIPHMNLAILHPFAPHSWLALGPAAAVAVASILVLGTSAGSSSASLAQLLVLGIGGKVQVLAAVAAPLLTLGAMNAYSAGAAKLGVVLGTAAALRLLPRGRFRAPVRPAGPDRGDRAAGDDRLVLVVAGHDHRGCTALPALAIPPPVAVAWPSRV